jgi:hypothetical protein
MRDLEFSPDEETRVKESEARFLKHKRTGDSDRRTVAHHVEQERREGSRRAIDRMQATHEEIHRIATTRATISEHYDEDMAEWADPQVTR